MGRPLTTYRVGPLSENPTLSFRARASTCYGRVESRWSAKTDGRVGGRSRSRSNFLPPNDSAEENKTQNGIVLKKGDDQACEG